MSIITLTTDYGLKDHFVGAWKGKIYAAVPDALIVDISHDIDPFNTAEAAYIIQSAYKSFPKNTIHIIGVDAERNKESDHIAIQWNDHFFIGADNGILSIITQNRAAEKMVAITIHDRLEVNATDVDVFTTVAANLSKGGALSVVGKEIAALKPVTEMNPIIAKDLSFIRGHIFYFDHYGNLVVNITKKMFLEVAKGRPYEIELDYKSKPLKTIFPNYSSIAASGTYNVKNYEGEKLAIFNEEGYLEIGVFRSNPRATGSAKSLLGLDYRDPITIKFK